MTTLKTNAGNAQPYTANVLTPTGWKQIGSLTIGDQVIGSQGIATTVVEVLPQGKHPIYQVTLSDRSAALCCEQHSWLIQSTNHRFRKQPGVVRQLKDFMGDLRMRNGNNRWYIPMVKPIAFLPQLLPLDSYLLGVLLGDGTLQANSTGVSSADADIIETVSRTLPPGVTLQWKGNYDYRITTGVRGARNPITDALRILGLAGRRAEAKFIPHMYQIAPIPDRIALLQGLLDTDGSVDGRNCIEITSVSERLARDVRALVQSLGGTARYTERTVHYTYKGERRTGQQAYRLTIALPSGITPFRAIRKAQRYTDRPKYPPSRAIVSVEPIGWEQALGIHVTAPDHLYVTDDFVITHDITMIPP
jgi:hypothetical protein